MVEAVREVDLLAFVDTLFKDTIYGLLCCKIFVDNLILLLWVLIAEWKETKLVNSASFYSRVTDF